MAAVNAGTRRRVLMAVVAGWILVVGGLGLWSVRHDPPTVPEQRGIADALPVLDRATGALYAAASAGRNRAVELDGLRIRHGCRLTPVRDGVDGVRQVTVYVAPNTGLTVLREIAAALPRDFAAEAAANSGGRRIALEADAGGFVAIDARAEASAQLIGIEVSTGCRPDAGERPPGPVEGVIPPAPLPAVLAALGRPGARAAERTVACPDGRPAGSYEVAGVAAPGDPGRLLDGVLRDARPVTAGRQGWGYLVAGTSVVVVPDGPGTLRVIASTPCE